MKDTDDHAKLCVSSVDIQTQVTYPKPGSKLYLKNYNKQLKHPFVVYADFETLNIPVELPPSLPKTYKLFDQRVCSYGYIYVMSDGIHSDPIIYRGEDAGVQF